MGVRCLVSQLWHWLLSGYEWTLQYSLSKHGATLTTLVSKSKHLPSCVILVETTTGECRWLHG